MPALAPPAAAAAAPQRRLLDQLREQLRYLHYSLRTEKAYVHWVRAFVRWSGMRITEALQLRSKDVDFERAVIVVRDGKGGKDRVVMLPASLAPALKTQLRRAHGLWQADAHTGRGGVQMPDALEREVPRAGASWAWFWLRPQTLDLAGAKSACAAAALRLLWVFPQGTLSVDPRSGIVGFAHMSLRRNCASLVVTPCRSCWATAT